MVQGPPGTGKKYVDGCVVFCIHQVIASHVVYGISIEFLSFTGKTSVAAAIGFGFALQCRTLSASGNAKVLATACSNVGADNLADRLLKLGLKVVRVGRPSAVTESLWDHTLDAYIDRDPSAQHALEQAARATAALKASRSPKKGDKGRSIAVVNESISRDLATAAVKESIKVS